MSYFGLIGYPLSHSSSQKLFQHRFASTHQYDILACQSQAEVVNLLKNSEKYSGFNVTIPYKEFVINLLDELSPEAASIQAVNAIVVEKNGKKMGYNTDSEAFKQTLVEWLPRSPASAVVLGSGGSAKAVEFALKSLKIPYSIASRNPLRANSISYQRLAEIGLTNFELMINTTPCGMFPNTQEAPPIALNEITECHSVYDLIYNPPTTTLLQAALAKGAKTLNGAKMLALQAALSWKIWGLID